jgi:hypothetical protein
MMGRTVAAASRLRFGSLFVAGGVEFWDLTRLPEVPARLDESRYRLLDTDQLDLLADRFYGDPQLWWVLAHANDMVLLPTDLAPGVEIRVPSRRYVFEEYLNLPMIEE